MRNFFCASVCLVLFGLPVKLLASVNGGKSMQVVSMNVHCFNDDWQFRFQNILDRFIQMSPEVIGLQEVCYDPQTQESQINFIRNYLLEHGYPLRQLEAQYTHQAWDKYDEYLVLLTKANVSAIDKGTLPPSLMQRGYIGFAIEQNWYITTHLEYRADNSQYRYRQIEFLTRHFANLGPHVIFGDFNSSTSSDEQGILRNAQYRPVFPGDSHWGNDGNASQSIDGFWLSPNLNQQVRNLNSYVFLNEYVQGRRLSDHDAVFMQMDWY